MSEPDNDKLVTTLKRFIEAGAKIHDVAERVRAVMKTDSDTTLLRTAQSAMDAVIAADRERIRRMAAETQKQEN